MYSVLLRVQDLQLGGGDGGQRVARIAAPLVWGG